MKLSKATIARYMQVLLTLAALGYIYSLAKPDSTPFASVIGIATAISIFTYFAFFIYALIENRKNGVELMLNVKGAKQYKKARKTVTDSDELKGDEFSRFQNYKATAKAWNQTMIFFGLIFVLNFINSVLTHTTGERGLLSHIDGVTMLIAVFAYMSLLLPVKLYEVTNK